MNRASADPTNPQTSRIANKTSPAQPMSMSWCLDCHRAPEQKLRPLDQVTNLGWNPENVDRQALGERLKKAWNIHPPESCGACHR